MEKSKAKNRLLFWIAQIIGGSATLLLIIFFLGTFISELIDVNVDTSLKDDYFVFLLGFCEILLGISIILSWKRPMLGGYCWTAISIIIAAVWGISETITILYFHLPAILSGFLMLIYAYGKKEPSQ